MPPTLTEDQIDDLLYFARTDALRDFQYFVLELCVKLEIHAKELFGLVWDEETGNGVLHMCAANGHHCTPLPNAFPP
jgi:hypothetical protein